MTSDQFQQFRKQQFRKWLWDCPVPFEYLNHDPEGQIAYVFHTKFNTHIDPLKEQSLPIKSGDL
jgi:hypothetical protein